MNGTTNTKRETIEVLDKDFRTAVEADAEIRPGFLTEEEKTALTELIVGFDLNGDPEDNWGMRVPFMTNRWDVAYWVSFDIKTLADGRRSWDLTFSCDGLDGHLVGPVEKAQELLILIVRLARKLERYEDDMVSVMLSTHVNGCWTE